MILVFSVLIFIPPSNHLIFLTTPTDEGWGLLCGNMSASTWMHTGYTGTMLCGDPVNQFFTVFLTNRVYPNDSTEPGVLVLRRAFSNAVMVVLGLLGGANNAKPIMSYR